DQNLFVQEFFESIDNAVPTLVVTIARFLTWQLLVLEEQFSATIPIEQLHCDNAVVRCPILIVIPFPGEDNLLSRNELPVFAERAHFLPFRAGKVPLIFSTDAHVRSDIPGTYVFWSKPLSQLLRISPRNVNTSGRHVDEPDDFERCFLCSFLVHGFAFELSTNCFSSDPIIAVQPASKFFRAYAGVFGNVSIPVCVSFSRVLLPSGNNSNVTREFPGSPLYRQVYAIFFCGITSVTLQRW